MTGSHHKSAPGLINAADPALGLRLGGRRLYQWLAKPHGRSDRPYIPDKLCSIQVNDDRLRPAGLIGGGRIFYVPEFDRRYNQKIKSRRQILATGFVALQHDGGFSKFLPKKWDFVQQLPKYELP